MRIIRGSAALLASVERLRKLEALVNMKHMMSDQHKTGRCYRTWTRRDPIWEALDMNITKQGHVRRRNDWF